MARAERESGTTWEETTPDRQEETPLAVGAAVSFAHRGRTIHGHLLRRQGRRRLATVIDGGERLWQVPEAALTPAPGARRATMVTRHDIARAAWRVGDAVTFTHRDGVRRGRIVKLNATQAKVRCSRTLWDVPFGLLAGAGGSGRRQGARNGADRLTQVAAMARRLMDDNGLADWTFAFLEAERRLGDCHFEDRVIRIGRSHALDGSEAQVTDTILHEIAHALAGPEARHGPVWKAAARRLGATPRANVYEKRGR